MMLHPEAVAWVSLGHCCPLDVFCIQSAECRYSLLKLKSIAWLDNKFFKSSQMGEKGLSVDSGLWFVRLDGKGGPL
jgi:hypothetical protein